MAKTHFRAVFKSDHLGVADLEEFVEDKKRLVFTIKEVKQEMNVMVAGRSGSHNIAYFKEGIKPLVLNSTNSKMIKKFTKSSFVEDWSNVIIELYIDAGVKMKGDVVGGVRIKPTQPKATKEVLNPQSSKWAGAKTQMAENKMSFEAVSKHYSITKENYTLLCS